MQPTTEPHQVSHVIDHSPSIQCGPK